MATFTWGSCRGERDRFGANANGKTATRYGRIDTADITAAQIASGLPRIGDALHVSTPGIVVRTIDIQPVAGGQTLGLGAFPGAANTGLSEVVIQYDSSGGGDIKNPKPTVPGEAWTSIENGSTSINIYYAPEADSTLAGTTNIESLPDGLLVGPINDGNGISLDVATLAVTVTKSFLATASIPFNTYNSLRNTLNIAPITLPPLYNGPNSWTLAKGQGLYTGFVPEVQGELLVVKHQFKIATDHWVRIETRAPDGTLADRKTLRPRNYADHSGLV